ncbi:permease-like cell division protein FtsX [Nocardioides sp. NPDC127514]|jgi:cell division transport system permease protein|uniref:permease-like cell division protein FtsX n=1 Tax=unclassified Nocardioides TaxID=2615069 RepID=UPI001356A430
MQLRYVFTELRQGLRRNLSMHVAVALTLLVSLTLAGVGLLLREQAQLTEEVWGDELQITFYMCNGANDRNPQCAGAVDDSQKKVITDALEDNRYVDKIEEESQEQAYERLQALDVEGVSGPDPVVKSSDMWESYWVTMTDPHHSAEIIEAVAGLDGIDHVGDVHEVTGPILAAVDGLQSAALVGAIVLVIAALLLVANTIRLAAFARRREIGIMRLVGASTLYIALPFLLESLVVALVGIGLSGIALAAVMYFGVEQRLSSTAVTQWVGWEEFFSSFAIVAILGILLTLVPTLLLTRKYIKV